MHENRMKRKLNNKGFTIVELMITIFLISLVLTIAYGMLSYGNRIFVQGDSKADIQSNLRVSANFISDKIRYASNVVILADKPANITDSTKEYIYAEDGVLKYYDGHTVTLVPGFLDGVLSTIQFADNNTQNVYIRVNGTLRNESFQVETSAFLQNIGAKALAESNGAAIEFSPGVPVNADIDARPITDIVIKTVPNGITDTTIDGQVAFIATVSPADASLKMVEWVIASPVSYASIISTSATAGLLKFNGTTIGDSVTIRAKALDGSGVLSQFPITITVTDSAIVGGTSLVVMSNYDSIFQKNGELQMTAEILPVNSNQLTRTWTLNPNNISIATIGLNDGMLKTNSLNTNTGTIKVTATLETGELASKDINIIPNITGISINALPTAVTDGRYNGKITCTLSPGGRPATLANGVKLITWSISLKKCSVASQTKNSDGTLNLSINATGNNAYFDVTATVNPISGNGFSSNSIRVDF